MAVITIPHIRVKSSNVFSVGYSEKYRCLEVQFKSGMLYRYMGVPAETYSAFIRASSIGKYFMAYVRDRYRYKKITRRAKDTPLIAG